MFIKYVLALIPAITGVILGINGIISYYSDYSGSASLEVYLLLPGILLLISIITLYCITKNKKLRYFLASFVLLSALVIGLLCIIDHFNYPNSNRSFESNIAEIALLTGVGAIMFYKNRKS